MPSTSKLVVCISKITFTIVLMFFPLSTFAEYYFVKSNIQKKSCRCNYFMHSYRKNKMLVHKHISQHTKLIRRHDSTIYLPCREKNYNLDMITGDDDPYIYPGMNIDR